MGVLIGERGIVHQMRDQRAMLIQTAVSLGHYHISGNLSGREGGVLIGEGGIVRQMRDQRAMLIQTAVSLGHDHISGNLSGREGGGTYRREGYCASDEGPESHVNSNSCKSAT